MKNCGHMFREKLPFSDLWEELHKVAILKRKVRQSLEDLTGANGSPFSQPPWPLLASRSNPAVSCCIVNCCRQLVKDHLHDGSHCLESAPYIRLGQPRLVLRRRMRRSTTRSWR